LLVGCLGHFNLASTQDTYGKMSNVATNWASGSLSDTSVRFLTSLGDSVQYWKGSSLERLRFDAVARQWLLALSKRFYQEQLEVNNDNFFNFQSFDLKLGQ
jgi:hypothetical protein